MDNTSFDVYEKINKKFSNFFETLQKILFSSQEIYKSKPTYDKGIVIGLEGRWGSGKTSFIEYFSKKISSQNDFLMGKLNKESKKVIVVKYDAWKNDYFEEPFCTLIGSICRDFKDINEDINKTFKETAKALLPMLTSTISGGMYKKIEEVNKKIFDNFIDEYVDMNKKIDSFKQALKDLGKQDVEKEVPLKIIIIDELDRCSPTFAIKLLERIKHFFGAENTIFIVSMHREEFRHTVKKFYGHEFDAESYLSRFIDFSLEVPEDPDFMIGYLTENDLSPELINSNLSRQITEFFELSPRDKIRFYNYIKLTHPLMPTKLQWPIMILLVGFKIKNTAQFKALKKFQIKNEETTKDIFKKFLSLFNNEKFDIYDPQNDIQFFIVLLFYILSKGKNGKFLCSIEGNLIESSEYFKANYGASYVSWDRELAMDLIDSIGYLS